VNATRRGTALALNVLVGGLVPLVTYCGFLIALEPTPPWAAVGGVLFAACVGAVIVDARRARAKLVVAGDGLQLDGVPARLRTAWLGPGWLVVRGVLDRAGSGAAESSSGRELAGTWSSGWAGIPRWLAGRRDGRFRVSLFGFEVPRAEFARLRAFCVAALPRVNPRPGATRRTGR